MKKQVISEEIALNELESFAAKWIKKPFIKDEKPGDYQGILKESYCDILEAIMMGNLIIDENKVPTYKLISPIKNESGGIEVSEINFKTRIKPSVQPGLASGIDLKKDSFKFALNCIAYITGQTIAMLDNFEKEDYTVIRELSAVFM